LLHDHSPEAKSPLEADIPVIPVSTIYSIPFVSTLLWVDHDPEAVLVALSDPIKRAVADVKTGCYPGAT